MKKVLFIVAALSMCQAVFSQETEKVKTKATNEIKLNLLMTVLSFPEITYERIWGDNVGLGLSVGFPIESSDTNFRILPYGRFYFGESSTKSFFIEANTAIIGHEKYYYDYDYYNSKTQNTTDFGLGVAFGYKYINSKGLVGELHLGIGRAFGSYDQMYPRLGISIGKQF